MNEHVNPAKTPAAMAAARAEFDALRRENPEISFVDAVMADLCGALRGKRIPVGEAARLFESGMPLPYSIYLMDARGEMANPSGRGIGDGDPDGTAWPIPGTLTPVWNSNPPRARMFMTLCDEAGASFAMEPRAVLERVAQRFDELALTPVAALELEFFLIDEKRLPDGAPQPPLRPGSNVRENSVSVYGIADLDRYEGFLAALDKAAKCERVPVSATSSEYAPGQFEANLKHQPDVLAAADHAVRLKQIVKAAAQHQHCDATFMAKPYAQRAGSGLHIHLSLVDKRGRNVFDNGTAEGSEILRFAAGGAAALMAESMAVFAPNVNSYRRFSTAPVNRRWGLNNRSAGIRIPIAPGEARRMEHRVSGADANPYLALAAVLAGVHHGIVNKLDPGEGAKGNVAQEADRGLPKVLDDALARFKAAKTLPGYFGAEMVRLYSATKGIELRRVRSIINTWEYDWYL